MQKCTKLARFWSRVNFAWAYDSCWEWQGYRDSFGYGHCHGDENLAHRQSWHFVRGPVPKGLLVCHTCDNPACVRPHHLFLGTDRDNAQDCISKGRFVRAQHVKMTLDQIAEARQRYAAGEYQRVIGESMGISQAHISKIVRGRHNRAMGDSLTEMH